MTNPKREEVGDVVRFTLTDTATNLDVGAWRIDHGDLGLEPAIPFSIEKRTLHGGRQEGSSLVIVTAGAFTITVVPTRGMSLLEAICDGVRLGWSSPVEEVVHPAFMRLAERGGLGWLDGFNELLVRCGAEWTGHPSIDGAVVHTLHGRLGNTPASVVEVEIDRRPPHRIAVTGLVREQTFKLVDLATRARVVVTPGEHGFLIDDEIHNRADYERPYQMLYHANFGPPLLEEGSRLLGAVRRVAPFNEAAVPGTAGWRDFAGPTPGFDEMVFGADVVADEDGRGCVALVDAARRRGVALRWELATLPMFTLWKNTDTPKHGYVTGLEPGTNLPHPRRLEHEKKRIPRLGPGERRAMRLRFDLLRSEDEVEALAQSIDRSAEAIPEVVFDHPFFRDG